MKKVTLVVILVVVAVLVFVGAATLDSCKRLNRPCFGTTQQP